VTLSLAKNFAVNPQSYEKTSEMQKENLFFFSFPSASNFGEARVTKKRVKCKRKACFSFHFRVPVSSAKPELRKKVVVTKQFWKINAIRPKIKARRGKTRKFNLGQKANWGGLVKEIGCQIVTRSYSANCYILHSDECQKK